MSAVTILSLAVVCFSGLLAVSGKHTYINGVLVDVIDNCDPHDPNSCGPGKCCVKQQMMYIPEATGPKPVYRIQCRPLSPIGRLCFLHDSTEVCPCAAGLTCKPSYSTIGHCH